jgi:DNA-binding transcriptional LysR family regulator
MDLRQLEALHEVVATGSFKSAAAELNVTQSALSHRIRSLEEELETALFVREHRRVRLTAVGEQLARRVTRVFAEIDALRQEFRPQRSREPAGTLRVAATSVGVSYVYGDMFEQFIAQHPQVDLQVLGASTPQEAQHRLSERSCDVACVYAPQQHHDLEWCSLGSSALVLVVSPRHPLARHASVTVADVRRHPFVRHLPGTAARMASDAIFLSEGGGYPPVCTESSDVEYIKRIVALGLGVSNLHAFTLERELQAGTLQVLRLKGQQMPVQEFGLLLRQGARTVAAQRFLELCRAFAREHPMHFSLPQRRGPVRRALQAQPRRR